MDYVRSYEKPRIGVFGCGCWFYWQQFPGLRDRLVGHQGTFESRLRDAGVDVVSGDLVDTPEMAARVGDAFRREGVSLVFCYLSTYALSSTVLPVAQRAGVPMVIVALQPNDAIDYEHATTFMQLEHDNETSLPEICCALERAGIPAAGAVVGALHDGAVWQRVIGWCRVARARATVGNARIGVMGHVYEGMLDMNSDPTMFDGAFGMHCLHLELDDLQACVDAVTGEETQRKLGEIRALFTFPEPGADPIAGPARPEDLAWAAQVACGMDRLVEENSLTGLAYYYRGLAGNTNERLASSLIVGGSLLTARGVPVAGELDIKTCVAMLLLDRLEAGGSFAELHPCDFRGDIALVGHDGPHHVALAQGRPVLRGLTLYHGKRGAGVSVEFQLKHGPVTCVGLTQTADGRFKVVLAEGESLPGPIPATGNTNTRCRFPPSVGRFIENWSLEGPTHHFALGLGHVAGLVGDLCHCWGIEAVDVTEPGYRRPTWRPRAR
ncbi:MAG: L-fucose/L-arabinose isomerase family protein [Anaerolineae bacterium]